MTEDARLSADVQIAGAGAAVLVAHTALVVMGISEPTTIVANAVFASSLFVMARPGGLTRQHVGVAFRRKGWSTAAVASAVVVLVVLVVAGLGFLPNDPTLSRLTPADVWFRVLVAIPIGTAVCEELIFRGVLLVTWDRLLSTRWSTVIVSTMFGLWHVAAEADRTGGLGVMVLPGVLATGAVSMFVLCPLRRRTGDLAAPIAVHAVTNVSVFVAVFLASRGVG